MENFNYNDPVRVGGHKIQDGFSSDNPYHSIRLIILSTQVVWETYDEGIRFATGRALNVQGAKDRAEERFNN